MNNENARLDQFESEHGVCVWDGHFGFCPDGAECESGPAGFRFLPDRPAGRKREVQQIHWRIRLDQLQVEFATLKKTLADKAASGILRAEELAELKKLASDAQTASQMLAELALPDGPDEKAVAKAVRLFWTRHALAADCEEAAKLYQDANATANGRETAKLSRLAAKWQDAYGAWDICNQRYESLPDDVKRAANLRCWHELEQRARALASFEVENIQI